MVMVRAVTPEDREGLLWPASTEVVPVDADWPAGDCPALTPAAVAATGPAPEDCDPGVPDATDGEAPGTTRSSDEAAPDDGFVELTGTVVPHAVVANTTRPRTQPPLMRPDLITAPPLTRCSRWHKLPPVSCAGWHIAREVPDGRG